MERYPSVTTLRILDSRVSSSLEDKNLGEPPEARPNEGI